MNSLSHCALNGEWDRNCGRKLWITKSKFWKLQRWLKNWMQNTRYQKNFIFIFNNYIILLFCKYVIKRSLLTDFSLLMPWWFFSYVKFSGVVLICKTCPWTLFNLLCSFHTFTAYILVSNHYFCFSMNFSNHLILIWWHIDQK